jgi:asparagine synthetase B (glutamine-hydrolysing)
MSDAQTDNPYNLVEHVGGLASLGRALVGLTCIGQHMEFRSYSLDSDLLELCAQTPVEYRREGGLLQEALRLLAPKLYAIPYANTGMRFDTPGPVAWTFQMAGEAALMLRKKLGLAPSTYTNESWPDRAELLRCAPLRDILKATLSDEKCFEPSVFDAERLREVYEQHMSGKKQHTRMLLCLLTFGRWFSKYGPGG